MLNINYAPASVLTLTLYRSAQVLCPILSNITALKNIYFTFAALLLSTTPMYAVAPNKIDPAFTQAQQLLQKASNKITQSRKIILDANKTRKSINKLRAESRRATNEAQRKQLQEQANQLAVSLDDAQKTGATLRSESSQITEQAKSQFREGFVNQWPRWVRNTEPLTMDDSVMQFIAHNAQIRSVHPTMLNKMGTPTDNITQGNSPKNMTLIVPALAGQKAPPDLDIGAFQISREQQYVAHIEVNSKTLASSRQSNNVSAVPLNKIHQWRLMLSDMNGQPATNASIMIEGHMPGHVHGLPTQPQVTQEIAPGVYLVEGVKFQMKGWWVMKFIFDSETKGTPDEVTFNLVF